MERTPKAGRVRRAAITAHLAILTLGFALLETHALDLSHAVVVVPAGLSGPEPKAVTMLVEEVQRRSRVHWEVVSAWPTNAPAVVVVGSVATLSSDPVSRDIPLALPPGANAPEGFHLRVQPLSSTPSVIVLGRDTRGVTFGVGHLLRQLRLTRDHVSVADSLDLATAPRYPLRGHQLGYRPKTHSYDAWDLPQWEQYYRDLIVFGANAVELIPPRSDDDADSPHFPRPPMEMMAAMSRLADEYGLDVWIWYPAMDADYADPETVERALREWAEVFQRLPRIDAVFVPGGDPGHTPPRALMTLLEQQTRSLQRTHPNAQMWVSPQGFNQPWLDEFLSMLRDETPAWLAGVVFGPQVRGSLPALRAAIPARYPIRHYPDITHTRQCQYPVPDWDVAFAITEGRECINPRPEDQAAIFRLLQPHTIGFITYSEGCNDDVNKAIWSALGWDPDQPLIGILREYSRYFIGEPYREDLAQALLALERNWRGPLLVNASVETTLAQFQALERSASPQVRLNWRFQQALFRAYYDAYLRRRLLHETAAEELALDALRRAGSRGALGAMEEAEAILLRMRAEPVAPELRSRVYELAEALFQSIRMQLSVPRYQAIAVDRGASLDTLDYPLNNLAWLQEQFARIRLLENETDRQRALEAIVEWTNPGPGGFYDDLGNPARQPHLVRGLPFAQDPASLISAKTGFEEGEVVDSPDEKPVGALRRSWLDHAESLGDAPLRVRYRDLDPQAGYKIRVVYAGDAPKRKIRLVADETIAVHPFITKPFPCRPVEFEIPPDTTRDGMLELSWYREPGLGGNGRGCQVSELWLIRNPPPLAAPTHE